MPGTDVPEGTVVGALGFVPAGFRFEPWSVYAGSPVRLVKSRNKAKVMAEVERVRAALGIR
jgi:acetyltransferase-like isoleucine patch superfamily enzyme